jgi:predicted TIM-barrel fold metal-dependent hydrolase
MWGTDYPHPEGSWPKTKEKLLTFMRGIPEQELTQILGTNALECYNLNAKDLQPIAERIGPLKSDFA